MNHPPPSGPADTLTDDEKNSLIVEIEGSLSLECETMANWLKVWVEAGWVRKQGLGSMSGEHSAHYNPPHTGSDHPWITIDYADLGLASSVCPEEEVTALCILRHEYGHISEWCDDCETLADDYIDSCGRYSPEVR